ncbi:MAG TPA: cytochrome C oxidase subunit IV family protein [Byssovorax sp.]|jgi:cytochrome c oxidase subunit 4
MAKDDRADHAGHHGPSLGLTLGVYAVLLTLTGVTVAAAYQDLGAFSAVVAVGIAAIKGTLVVLYFMHLRYASKLIMLYAVSGLLFLALLIGVTLGEAAGRPDQPRVDPLAPQRDAPVRPQRAAEAPP